MSAKSSKIQGKPPKVIGDFRRALDDKSIDAIIVATPDHWHALATIWGCQAGKDVYVEKPISHSPWEGRKMVEAARRHNRIVQVGTQNRSAHYNILAKEYIESGKLGTIHMVRVYNQKAWPNFARAGRPRSARRPQLGHVDRPGARSRGTTKTTTVAGITSGDSRAATSSTTASTRWISPAGWSAKTYPKSVYSTGGRYAEKGVFESPDTQVAVFQFDDMVLTFELTLYTPYMLKSDQVLRDSDMYPYWPQNGERIEIYGSKGLMIVGRHGCGWQVFGRPKDRQPVIVHRRTARSPITST